MIIVDKNQKAIDAIKHLENEWLRVEHGDIFEAAKKYNAKIATASNPDFDFAGGLDAAIAAKFDTSGAKEFAWDDNLFYVASVDDSRRASKATVMRALAGIYAYRYKFDVVVSCIGTGIGGLTVHDFVDCVSNLSVSNLSVSDLRGADLSESNLSVSNLSVSDLRGADLSESNLRGADLSGADLRGADLSESNLRGADLSGADLRGADLRGADLRESNLRGADLSESNLSVSDLRGADLRGADLRESNLRGADLSESNLSVSDLRGADLRGADLRGADLRESNLRGADLSGILHNEGTCFYALQCPSIGAFIAWKKCKNDVIVKLLVPAKAKRSSATSRKCRAEYAKVLAVYGAEEGVSCHDSFVVYRVGETVRCHEWEEDRWIECGGGIHFFITREEAENYSL